VAAPVSPMLAAGAAGPGETVALRSTAHVGGSPPTYRPLGLFRFGLALLVVLQHFQHLLAPGQRALFSHMGFGAIAVCVFFAVSGYVVAEANDVFYAGRPGAFLANRALRIVPPYLAAFLLSAIVQSALFAAGRLVLWDYTLQGPPWAAARLASGALALIPGFKPQFLGQDFEFLPFVWSLRMEAAFYLVAAAVLATAARWGRGAIPAGFVLGLLASALFLTQGRPGLLSTAPMFLLGVALYGRQTRPGWRYGVASLAAIALALIGFASWRQHGEPILAAQLPLLAGLLVLFVLLAAARAPGRLKRLDRVAGELSYSLYLNHYPVGLVLSGLSSTRGAGLYCLGVVASVALAAAMTRVTEVPLRHLRDRIRARHL